MPLTTIESYVALWHWCAQRAKELAPPLSSGVAHGEDCLREHLTPLSAGWLAQSDVDEGPARQFFTEFVEYLTRLKYD